MLPGGRDFTIQFSPTRCHKAKQLNNKWFCVCCNRGKKPKPSGKSQSRDHEARRDHQPDYDDDDTDLRDFIVDDDSDGDDEERAEEEEEEEEDQDSTVTTDGSEDDSAAEAAALGPLVPIPLDVCIICQENGLRHYAHEFCLMALEESSERCPYCKLFEEYRRLED